MYILTISTNPNALEISLLIWLGALAAGFLGSLTGLGGGVVAETTILRRVFSIVLVMMAFRMVYTIFMAA